MAGEKALEKGLEPVVKKGFEGFWRRNYGVGMARDESAFRRLVAERGKSRDNLSKARSAVAGLETRAAGIEAAADRKLATFDAEQSRINRNALVDLWHTGNEHAVEVAQAEQLARLNTEGVKLTADLQKMSDEALALRTPTSDVAKPAYEELKAASRDFEAKVAAARAQQLRERSWFGARWNTDSHLYASKSARTPDAPPWVTPLPEASKMTELGLLPRATAEVFTGRGGMPRLVSGLARRLVSEVSPVRLDGKLGRVWDVASAPGTLGALVTVAAATRAAFWTGRKLGYEWATPDDELALKYQKEQEKALTELNTAKGTGFSKRIKEAQDKYDKIHARYAEVYKRATGNDLDKPPEPAGTPSAVDTANTLTGLAKITQDYRMTGDATARDNAIAAMPKETVDAALSAVRSSVFKAHHPGQDMEALGRTEAGRKFIGDFDTNVFGTRSANDWLTTDMGAYRRNLEASQIGR